MWEPADGACHHQAIGRNRQWVVFPRFENVGAGDSARWLSGSSEPKFMGIRITCHNDASAGRLFRIPRSHILVSVFTFRLLYRNLEQNRNHQRPPSSEKEHNTCRTSSNRFGPTEQTKNTPEDGTYGGPGVQSTRNPHQDLQIHSIWHYT